MAACAGLAAALAYPLARNYQATMASEANRNQSIQRGHGSYQAAGPRRPWYESQIQTERVAGQ